MITGNTENSIFTLSFTAFPYLRLKLWAFRNNLHAASDADKHAPFIVPTSELLDNISLHTINITNSTLRAHVKFQELLQKAVQLGETRLNHTVTKTVSLVDSLGCSDNVVTNDDHHYVI